MRVHPSNPPWGIGEEAASHVGDNGLRFVDWALAVCLCFASSLVYSFGFQDVLFGDAAQLVSVFAKHNPSWHHSAYFPIASGVKSVFGLGPSTALQVVSWAGGGALVGFTYLLVRRAGSPVLRAVPAVLLVALAPATFFFSTVIEVHAPHGAAVAAGGLVVLVSAPTRLRQPCVGLAAAAAFLTHQSGALLAPSFALLSWSARSSSSRTIPSLALGMVCSVASVLGAAFLNAIQRRGFAESVERSAAIVKTASEVSTPAFLPGVIVPLGILSIVATFGFARASNDLRLASLAAILPILAFVIWLTSPERGGYLIGVLPFFALLASQVRGGTRVTALLCAACVLQGFLGVSQVARGWDAPAVELQRARVSLVKEALGLPCALIRFTNPRQTFTLHEPALHELNASPLLASAIRAGQPPSEFADEIVRVIRDHLVARPGTPLGLDVSYRGHSDLVEPEARPYLTVLDSRLTAAFPNARVFEGAQVIRFLSARRDD